MLPYEVRLLPSLVYREHGRGGRTSSNERERADFPFVRRCTTWKPNAKELTLNCISSLRFCWSSEFHAISRTKGGREPSKPRELNLVFLLPFVSFACSAFLASLRDQNQVLFYRLMSDHLKELLGVLYTPGAAEVSSNEGEGGDLTDERGRWVGLITFVVCFGFGGTF